MTSSPTDAMVFLKIQVGILRTKSSEHVKCLIQFCSCESGHFGLHVTEMQPKVAQTKRRYLIQPREGESCSWATKTTETRNPNTTFPLPVELILSPCLPVFSMWLRTRSLTSSISHPEAPTSKWFQYFKFTGKNSDWSSLSQGPGTELINCMGVAQARDHRAQTWSYFGEPPLRKRQLL